MSLGYEIDIEGLDEQVTLLEAYDSNVDHYLEIAMLKSVNAIENNIKPFAPVDRGRLRSSITTEVSNMITLSQIVGRVGPSLKAEVYPQVMEFGREPGHFPPLEPIQAWVKRVIRPPEKELRSVAFLVARKIYRSGIKGREYLKQGYEKSIDDVKRYFVDALEEIAKGLSNGRL